MAARVPYRVDTALLSDPAVHAVWDSILLGDARIHLTEGTEAHNNLLLLWYAGLPDADNDLIANAAETCGVVLTSVDDLLTTHAHNSRLQRTRAALPDDLDDTATAIILGYIMSRGENSIHFSSLQLAVLKGMAIGYPATLEGTMVNLSMAAGPTLFAGTIPPPPPGPPPAYATARHEDPNSHLGDDDADSDCSDPRNPDERLPANP